MAKKANKKSATEKKEPVEESDENGFSIPVHKSEEDVIKEEQKALLNEQHALFRDKFDHPARYWWRHNYKTFIFFVVLIGVVTGLIIYYKMQGN